jgi:hypothetical protein
MQQSLGTSALFLSYVFVYYYIIIIIILLLYIIIY